MFVHIIIGHLIIVILVNDEVLKCLSTLRIKCRFGKVKKWTVSTEGCQGSFTPNLATHPREQSEHITLCHFVLSCGGAISLDSSAFYFSRMLTRQIISFLYLGFADSCEACCVSIGYCPPTWLRPLNEPRLSAGDVPHMAVSDMPEVGENFKFMSMFY